MSEPLKTYRLYCYDGSAMTLTGDLIEARTDADAVSRAEARRSGSKCEVWQGDRLVAELTRERRQA